MFRGFEIIEFSYFSITLLILGQDVSSVSQAIQTWLLGCIFYTYLETASSSRGRTQAFLFRATPNIDKQDGAREDFMCVALPK